MKTIVRGKETPGGCAYLPGRTARKEYMYVAALDRDEYMAYLLAGWRRFGRTLFRPRCPSCSACQSLRIDPRRFEPDRGQRRCRKTNEGAVRLEIGAPAVTRAKMALFDRFHDERSEVRGWPVHPRDTAADYVARFVDNPFPTQEWCYYLDGALVGIGYVDDLPGGLSAIYFGYEPAHRERSLGTWNVLSLIDRALALALPHVYLGYCVAGCPSLEYKARFRPHQILDADGEWRDCIPSGA
ncbi:MAG: arginyltransferase [Isosphaeraceae bacterium]|nr:arginyltransferase [Isosphaeraceae bacterium]